MIFNIGVFFVTQVVSFQNFVTTELGQALNWKRFSSRKAVWNKKFFKELLSWTASNKVIFGKLFDE